MAEEEYESDPEESKPSLAMRRRQASDDEEGEEEEGDDEQDRDLDAEKSRIGVVSDADSDGEGAAPVYEEDGEEEEEEDYEDVGEEEEVEYAEVEAAAPPGVEIAMRFEEERSEINGEGHALTEEREGVEEEQEKKEVAPFAVPTAGAFYMHDDRFRERSGGRNRRTLVGRKLWESKDERKWGHDKFEELSFQERGYEEGRRISKDERRARGRNRGTGRGFARGSRTRVQTNTQILEDTVPRVVKGRGPRRYESLVKNRREAHPAQNRRSGKFLDRASPASSHRKSFPTLNGDSNSVTATKQIFASNLNSASPPFYPSGSSNKDIALPQKMEAQSGASNRHPQSQVAEETFSVPQSSAMMRGKNIVDSVSVDKLYINDSVPPLAGKPLASNQLPPPGSSLINATRSSQPKPQGRGVIHPAQMNFSPSMPHSQLIRALPIHGQTAERTSVQNRGQPSQQSSAQVLGQYSTGGSQSSPSPKAAMPVISIEPGEESSESSKSKTALVGKGRVDGQGNGRGSFLYSSGQAMGAHGNMGVGHGDQNFPATPTFLPVMQFGGQHTRGIGVPAVGMAFPGYVGQPNGRGNSEMTWLPVLAGTGALGATYCPPYLTVDGTYHARPSGQASATGSSSKETTTNQNNNEGNPLQGPELANDEFGQRQNKSRRYSAMNIASEALR